VKRELQTTFPKTTFATNMNPPYTPGGGVAGCGYPDFLLLDYDVYVKYWGMADVEDNADRERYVRKMKWKMVQYHRNGIKFVSLYRSNLDNLDWIFRAKLKEVSALELRKDSL
jgi:hypothetical protein